MSDTQCAAVKQHYKLETCTDSLKFMSSLFRIGWLKCALCEIYKKYKTLHKHMMGEMGHGELNPRNNKTLTYTIHNIVEYTVWLQRMSDDIIQLQN